MPKQEKLVEHVTYIESSLDEQVLKEARQHGQLEYLREKLLAGDQLDEDDMDMIYNLSVQ